MRQHRHTATVVLCLLAGLARADFTAAWNDYFATEQIAAEAYSGSVERCHAVGVTPHAPSWWDYLTGKNRAKLLSVKQNIRNTYKAFIDPTKADETGSYLGYLASGSPNALAWTNEAGFLTSCGLPTNALDETPWFKLQYTNTLGGWHTARTCLSNMIVTKAAVDWTPNVWSNRNAMAIDVGSTAPYTFSSLPWIIRTFLLGFWHELLDVDISRSMTDTADRYYEFTSYYQTNLNEVIPSLPIPLPLLVRIYNPKSDPPEFYAPNARGSWTTSPDVETWATNFEMSVKGWKTALTMGTSEWPTNTMESADKYGISWTNALYPYMVKTRPRSMMSAKAVEGEEWTEPTPQTNLVYTNEVVYPQIEEVTPIYEEFSYDITTTNIVTYTNDFLTLTNYYSVTNPVISVVSSNAVTNEVQELYVSKTVTVAYAFGAAFVGSYVETNGYEYAMRGSGVQTTAWEFVYITNMVPTNVAVPTNVVDGSVYTFTNIETTTYSFDGDQIGAGTNWVDDLANPQTNAVTNEVVVLVSNKVTVNRYASGAVIANGIPYVGAEDIYKQLGIAPVAQREYPTAFPYTNYAAMSALYTGIAHSVDIYYRWSDPTNVPFTVPIWHGYVYTANPNNGGHAYQYSTFAASDSPGWRSQRLAATSNDVVFGDNVYPNGNVDGNDDLSDTVQYDAMEALYRSTFGFDGPEENQVQTIGREVDAEWAAVWWNGENGFKWK